MSSRTAREFAGFCLAVHGYEPFPWQQALVEQVLQEGTWPDVIDVPTGLGKTMLIDIAVVVAAATARQTGVDRAGRRRLFFVVDRRLVVDEAHQHALAAAAALAAAEREPEAADPLVAHVVAGLRSLAPHAGGEPLSVARMRGGTSWSANWLDRADRPAVVVGTVDQVGSRLFFRGYGVSDRRKPLDAALVGTDSLVVVDEAHLADAFLQTLSDALGMDGHGLPVPRPHVVQLSATARSGAAHRFVCDLGTHLQHPEAGRRLRAGKRLHLMEVADRKRVAHAMAGLARDGGRAPGFRGPRRRQHRPTGASGSRVADRGDDEAAGPT